MLPMALLSAFDIELIQEETVLDFPDARFEAVTKHESTLTIA